MTIDELKGKSVAIIGLGANNWELTRFLAGEGIALTVLESNPARQEEFTKAFPDLVPSITWKIGEKILSNLTAYQIVFRSPAIPYLSPELKKAQSKGVQVYSQTRLFFDLCPAPIIGVSGTKGKGTTCTLLSRILEAGYTKGKTYLAGNIGLDPFSFYDQLTPDDVVILELSSFQLQDLHRSPHLTILLNVAVDHLNHHKTVEEYQDAKSSLVRFQGKDDSAIINVQDPAMRRYIGLGEGKKLGYSRFQPRRQSVWADKQDGKETIFVQVGEEIDSFDSTDRLLLGEHNLDNILPAVLAARMYGVDIATIQKQVVSFPGLEHRLSYVGRFIGVDFYDDSIATTPESCQVALEAFAGRRIHLIAGGNDKGWDCTELGKSIAASCFSVSFLPGTATAKIRKAIEKGRASDSHLPLLFDQARDPLFPTILSGIHTHLQEGDVVLLSPAATSFGSFLNSKQRGELFVQAVHKRYGKLEA